MFRTILVPLNGSELAASALPYAEALAVAYDARLVLVRAVADGARQQSTEVQAYLGKLAAELASRGRRVETSVALGSPEEVILTQTWLHGADLIAMGTHSRSQLGRWFYGSVAELVIAHSPVPVLLVRNGQPTNPALPFGQHPRVLVPLDGSTFAEAALSPAIASAVALGAGLVLLRSVPGTDRVLTADGRVVALLAHGRQAAALEFLVEERRKDALAYLSQVADRLPLTRANTQVDVRVGPPAESIAAASREHGAALAVMATHARIGLGQLLFGSVAGGVMRHTSAPLLLIRPPRRQRGGRAAA